MTTLIEMEQCPTTAGGVYDLPEAARYLNASNHADKVYPSNLSKLIRWIRRGLLAPEMAGIPGDKLLIGFEDLISMRVIAALRTADVSWAQINVANLWLQDYFDVPYPLAVKTLWVEQGAILTVLFQASRHGQTALHLLREYVMPVHGLTFDDETRLANSWEPMPGVLLHPQIHSGTPCIKGTRVPTWVITGAIEAGDPPNSVAKDYGISLEEIQVARDWESHVQSN